VDEIRRVLSAYEPHCGRAGDGNRLAAVALIFAGSTQDPSLLFIERAERQGDRWSGQMAFPGGRWEKVDAGMRETAERETREEVGIELASSELLGRLDDQGGHRAGAPAGLRVSPFVFFLEATEEPVPNEEVQSAMWVPLSVLLDPARSIEYRHRGLGGPFEGILVGEPERHVVWGLTRRILRSLVELLGRKLP